MPHSRERPFENFRAGITDPEYCFGRDELIARVQDSPFRVRIFLGGSRMGKTSTLHKIKERLLCSRRAFPVLFNLDHLTNRGADLENLLYRLFFELEKNKSELREKLDLKGDTNNSNSYFGQDNKLTSNEFEKRTFQTVKKLRNLGNFEGICFLLDGAEQIPSSNWGDRFARFFQAIKEDNPNLGSCLGLVLSGDYSIRSYKEQRSSPLAKIATKFEILPPLKRSEMEKLISHRCEKECGLKYAENLELGSAKITVDRIENWTGCHPYLVQQILNILIDHHLDDHSRESQINAELLFNEILENFEIDFYSWWGGENPSYCFSQQEKVIYKELIKCRQSNPENLVKLFKKTNVNFNDKEVPLEVQNSLDSLVGTGLIKKSDDDEYIPSNRLFEEWVKKIEP